MTARPPRAFPDGALVRVKGTHDQVLALFGREVVGAVGVIVRSARRSQGQNRYLVTFPAHTYVTPIQRLVRDIAALDVVIREELLEPATAPILATRTETAACTTCTT